jgi:colanic acid/amylovoran biosynthesis glycosyltransferase
MSQKRRVRGANREARLQAHCPMATLLHVLRFLQMTSLTAPEAVLSEVGQGSEESAQPPRVRTAIAVFVSRFPRLDETSILREMNELERQGQPVVLVPLLRGRGKVIHEEAKPWLRRALYMPLLSFGILSSNLHRMIRQPHRYFGLLGRVIGGTFTNPSVMLKSIVLFPKSVRLADILPRHGIEHVHAQFATHPATMAYIVSSLSNISFSFTVHGPDVFVHRLLLRDKIRRSKFVRAVSTFNKAFLSGLYSPDAEEKIQVVHTGVNPAVYAGDGEAEAGADVAHEKPRILSVASLNRTKGFSFLIDACARVVNKGLAVDMSVVGGGHNAHRIEHAIKEAALTESIRMLGPKPQHEVARLMRECDVFVLPSVIAHDGQMDGLPIALIEAMAAGKPVIAAPISGIPELVRHGSTGLLVDMTHPDRIAEALQLLITDPDLREQLGRAGQERVRSAFDITVTAQKLIALFDRHEREQPTAKNLVTTVRWDQIGVVALGMRRIHERNDSVIAEVTTTDGIRKRDVVVKRQRDRAGQSRPAEVRARDEFLVLRRLRREMVEGDPEATGTIAYNVPNVLLFDPKNCAIVMERAHGLPLDVLLRRARLKRNGERRLVTPVRRAGRWLRYMHQTSRFDDDGRHLLTALVLNALEDLELVAAADRTIRRRRTEVADRLRALEARVAERPLPVVGQHGDYWPGNIFIGERKVQVIDFEGYREGLPLDDVAYFLLQLKAYFSYPLIRRPYAGLARAFLDGAGVRREDEEALELFVTAKALRSLAGGGARQRPRSLRDRLQRGALRDAVLERLI